jgi:DNA-binding NarL/FixJ family response regulator
MINVQIVDDHIMVAESLSIIINKSGFARVTNLYHTLHACSEGLTKQLPDILLLDIGMPDGDGVKFCAQMTKIYPDIKIIMLTGYREFNIVKYAMLNGARGYILKNAESEEMFKGLKIVNNGKQFLSKDINNIFDDPQKANTIWLTDIERKILKLCAEGYTQRQIAVAIDRDFETVKSHLKNIRIKLNAKNTTQAVRTGDMMGLL